MRLHGKVTKQTTTVVEGLCAQAMFRGKGALFYPIEIALDCVLDEPKDYAFARFAHSRCRTVAIEPLTSYCSKRSIPVFSTGD